MLHCYCWAVKKDDVVWDTDEMMAKRLAVEEDLMKTSWDSWGWYWLDFEIRSIGRYANHYEYEVHS